MKNTPSLYPCRAHQAGSALGKFAATLASLLTIAAILFVGSRDWKAHESFSAALTDVSDIRGLFSKAGATGGTATAVNEVERSLLEKGTLVRRSPRITGSNVPGAPTGVSREFVNAY